MAYFTDLFSPETYDAFSRSDKTITGFRMRQRGMAERVQPGDKFVCYMTKLSRWIGVLEATSECFVDETPLFYPSDDPFVVRFTVNPVVWLPKNLAIPIHDERVWERLTFTRGTKPSDPGWTGVLRRSLNLMRDEDGGVLEELILAQHSNGTEFPVDEEKFRRLVTQRIRRADKTVTVTVPTNDDADEPPPVVEEAIRESASIQGLLASVGEKMGFNIWLPRSDRSTVLKEWHPQEDSSLIDVLPLNYDETTLQTIEQIDVLWLKGRSIIRAFEVEHTTAVYSGILRMADLLALQPNMDIRLHIVAPESRRDKVLMEIQRPVFSLLDRAPLSECCTFISYGSLRELASSKHIAHLSDSVLEEFEEQVD
ncbi:MAG: hypothetical protein EA377_12970 [Phycisphaerales bacterium]|nr:MAG: hypothetical protein EA377_12970 [Phycisphaerales bacterium]